MIEGGIGAIRARFRSFAVCVRERGSPCGKACRSRFAERMRRLLKRKGRAAYHVAKGNGLFASLR